MANQSAAGQQPLGIEELLRLEPGSSVFRLGSNDSLKVDGVVYSPAKPIQIDSALANQLFRDVINTSDLFVKVGGESISSATLSSRPLEYHFEKDPQYQSLMRDFAENTGTNFENGGPNTDGQSDAYRIFIVNTLKRTAVDIFTRLAERDKSTLDYALGFIKGIISKKSGFIPMRGVDYYGILTGTFYDKLHQQVTQTLLGSNLYSEFIEALSKGPTELVQENYNKIITSTRDEIGPMMKIIRAQRELIGPDGDKYKNTEAMYRFMRLIGNWLSACRQ